MSRSQSKSDQNNHKYDLVGRKMRSHTIMSQEDVASGKKSYWPELEITGTIRNLSPQLWQLSHLTTLYLNDNDLSRLPGDIAKLTCLIHLDLSYNKLRSLPAELGDLVFLRELLLSHNYLRVLPYEIGKLFQLQNLGLSGNPLNPDIMQLHSEPNGTSKLLCWLLENLAFIAEHPPQRPWIPLAHPDRTRPTSIFTVMCYNVLCDKYATRQLYGYCPNWALNWEYRRKGILDEIRHYAADIISLQEIETEQFYNFFLPELKHDGYDGIFSPKSRAKTMSESERKYVDGCAIFFRTNKFSLIKEHLIEFNQLAMANAEGSDVMLNRVMPKDNIGLTALLETKEAAWTNGVPNQSQVCQPLLVCTAHIHWDPEFCDVKLIQTMMLLKELRNFINEETQHSFRCNASKSADASMPIVFCGDLNSLPRSGVCELMTKGRISADHEDFKGLGYKDCLQKLGHNDRTNEYTHNLNLASTYSSDIMPYTNYTFDFKGIIDYIFYQKQFMTPLGLLGPLDPDWLKENKIAGCPHPHIPSDHFPLLCELELAPPLNQVISNGVVIRR